MKGRFSRTGGMFKKGLYYFLMFLLIMPFNLLMAVNTADAAILGQAVTINEVMVNPSNVSDYNGEWIELYNPASGDVDINGFTIKDGDSDSHVIDNGGSLIIPAGGYLVLGKNGNMSTNGGVTVDYVYGSDIDLSNTEDEIIITVNSIEIDRVEYDNTWSFDSGKSMLLTDWLLDNNVKDSWCTSSSSYGDGDLGTPGVENDICGGEVVCTDEDADGFSVEGGECGVIDCDDTDELINPDMAEVCGNLVDEDCSGMADECEAVCGDSKVDTGLGEECDDGNVEDGDGCSSTCEIQRIDCPFTAVEGESYIIDFTDKLYSSRDLEYQQLVNAFIPAGDYKVTLVAFDGKPDRDVSLAQLNEQYDVILQNNGQFVAQSGITEDLEDNVLFASKVNVVNNSLTLSTDINEVVANHSFYYDNTSANSVEPICAFFEPAPSCGNGIVETDLGEECDDGNTEDGDGCSSICEIQKIDCPFTAVEGESYVVNFTERLYSSKTYDDSYELVNAFIPAGDYKVTLAAFDGKPDRDVSTIQLNEQYDVILQNNGQFVTKSGMTEDLEDSVLYASEVNVVNNSLTLSMDINEVVANHPLYYNNASANSVEPVCAFFEPAPTCGNEDVEDGEECDDGNTEDSDGCSATCEIEAGDIFGVKFNDINANGVLDAGEPNLEGWEINLYDYAVSTTTPISVATTTISGYSFPNLDFGSYVVTEVNQAGWTQTTPTTTETIILSNDNKSVELNFGNAQPSVCTDLDQDTYAIEGGECGIVDCDDTDPLIFENCEPTCTPGNDNDNDGYYSGGTCSPFDCDDNSASKTTDCGGGGGGGPTGLYIHSERVGGTTTSTATITWHTNKSADSKVVCSLSPIVNSNLGSWPELGYGAPTGSDATFKTFHTIVLDNLLINTNYYCRTISKTSSQQAYSSELSFIILEEGRIPACGDGIVDSNEDCDDGNTISGDGCSATCGTESCAGADYIFETNLKVIGENCQLPGWTIYQNQDLEDVSVLETGLYSVYAQVHRSGPEESQPAENFIFTINGKVGNIIFDRSGDEALRTQLAGDFVFLEGDNTIVMDTGTVCPPENAPNSVDIQKVCLYKIETDTLCGNGILETDEACDDGNLANGDSCSNTCTIETAPVAPTGGGTTPTGGQTGNNDIPTLEQTLDDIVRQTASDEGEEEGIIGEGEQSGGGEVLGEKVVSEEAGDGTCSTSTGCDEEEGNCFADWWWLVVLLVLVIAYLAYEKYAGKDEEGFPKDDKPSNE
jgi:cysteine-rich repeat protein